MSHLNPDLKIAATLTYAKTCAVQSRHDFGRHMHSNALGLYDPRHVRTTISATQQPQIAFGDCVDVILTAATFSRPNSISGFRRITKRKYCAADRPIRYMTRADAPRRQLTRCLRHARRIVRRRHRRDHPLSRHVGSEGAAA